MIKASRKLLCLLSIRLAHWKIRCSDSQRFQTSPSKAMPTLGLNRPTLEGKWKGKEKKVLYMSFPTQLQLEVRLLFLLGACFLVRTWVAKKASPSRAWQAVGHDDSEMAFSAHIPSGVVTSFKLQFGRLSGRLRHQGISRWLQGRVSFLKTLKQARNSQSSSLRRDGPSPLKTPHSAAYPESAFSGNSSLLTPCWSSTAHSSQCVLIWTPSPHPCVSAHLQMTHGLIRRKYFTVSSPRKSFMTWNYKPLREHFPSGASFLSFQC